MIVESFDKLMQLDLQFVLLGTGQKEYEDFFRAAEKKHPEKFSATMSFNDELAHLIEAGADMFLMPSKYEPCGLNQMYSLKYGTIPIVRATGGLVDTVRQYKSGKGNGFVFEKYTAGEMMKAIKEALEVYRDQKNWVKIVQNGMASDFSWESSAKKYDALYRKLMEVK